MRSIPTSIVIPGLASTSTPCVSAFASCTHSEQGINLPAGAVNGRRVVGMRHCRTDRAPGLGFALAVAVVLLLAGGIGRTVAADASAASAERPVTSDPARDASSVPVGQGSDAQRGASAPAWVIPDLPKPDTQGWMKLFDGEHVYGVSPTNRNIAAGHVFRKNNLLVLDASAGWNGGLRIPWKGTNAALRFRGRNVSSQNVGIGLGGTYVAWCNGDPAGMCGIGQTVRGVYKDIRTGKSGEKPDDMFDMEFRIEKENLTLLINGQVRVQAKAPWVDELRAISVGSVNGVAVVERVEARLPR